MNRFVIHLLLILTCLLLSSYSTQTKNHFLAKTKPKVALLGMFHFAGSTEDLAAIKLEDPLGGRRQREILDLVNILAQYKPTKILVEYPKSRQNELLGTYQDYMQGKDSLGVSETYQVGFRLAKKLQHSTIYAIDHKLSLPTNKIVEYCQRTNRMEAFNQFIGGIKNMMQKETTHLKNRSIKDYLAYMNTDEIDRKANNVYLNDMLQFGDSISEAGVAVSARWWKRNMMILNNISSTIDHEDDKILVIIGAAHRAVIKDFIEDRSDMEYYEIGQLL